jgi:hydroxymethylpyrimidine/phosphomethylpyrimidine kinase
MLPTAMTIAGSDSGGSAGIQADLRTFQRFGVSGTTAITAITAQNADRIARVQPVSPAMVRAQIDAIVAERRPAAVKSGMLATAAIVHTVARAIRAQRLHPYVLDPVLVATSGRRLLSRDGAVALRRTLLPLSDIVTPNLDEAAALTGDAVSDLTAMERAARDLVDRLGAGAALVTGGHLSGSIIVDVFYDGRLPPVFYRAPRILRRRTHGTGCRLSAAIAAHLALGRDLATAVAEARAYVRRTIRSLDTGS